MYSKKKQGSLTRVIGEPIVVEEQGKSHINIRTWAMDNANPNSWKSSVSEFLPISEDDVIMLQEATQSRSRRTRSQEAPPEDWDATTPSATHTAPQARWGLAVVSSLLVKVQAYANQPNQSSQIVARTASTSHGPLA